ncbi:MAG: hypothetical protein OES13_04610 [Acidimicrobiia bacterium]|nr:hypothetical protein [Acidimicrobiia bacterium]
MPRLVVEPWSAEYGGPLDFETDPDEAPAVVPGSEGPWEPMASEASLPSVIAFVDGVRRPDARLTVDEGGSALPIPGVAGSYAVGAVRWYPEECRSEFDEIRIERVVVCGEGAKVELPPVGPGLVYTSMSSPERSVQSLVQTFHGAMRVAEDDLAEDLARAGYLVFADGPINTLSALRKVGYIKTHRVSYLPPELIGIIPELGGGQRTPFFRIPDYKRNSWYLRLGDFADGHSWSGVVRCEVAHAVGDEMTIELANISTTVLPMLGSEPFRDPRAPQNLVPIAGLERELRRRLGAAPLIHRFVTEAVQQVAV